MSTTWSRLPLAAASLAVVLIGVSIGTAAPARAQTALGASDLYAYIYEGTCATPPAANARLARVGELDSIEFGLDDLFDGDEVEERMGLPREGGLYQEDRDFRASLAQLTDSPHVVIVRDEAERGEPIVACGEITGETQDGVLRIDVAPVAGSDVAGIALFEPETNVFGTDEIEVTVQVPTASEIATPAA